MAEPRPFLTASWRHLAMLNYDVAPQLLRPLVPAGTELDTWDGACLASLVGFRFLDTRVLGLPIPGHRDFDEVNLRFYVRRRDEGGAWRRAVVFVREFVPRRAIAAVARWCYNEPYTAVPMRHEIETAGGGDGQSVRAAYAWRAAGRWHRLEVRTRGPAALPAPASEAAFITEHYWGLTVQRDGGANEYRVAHPAWRVWETEAAQLDCDAKAVYGAGLAEYLSASPRSAFLAEGSEVTVHAGRRLGRAGSDEAHPGEGRHEAPR